MYHRFITFFREFEGDVLSCTCLYNAYINRRLAVAEKQLKEALQREANSLIDKTFLRSKDVVAFITKVDETFRKSMEKVMCDWTNHSQPLVSTTEMKDLITNAKTVFGPLWRLHSKLRGVMPNVKEEQQRNVDREHSVFFLILSLVRVCNRHRLQHWAFVQNITNIARGWVVLRKLEYPTLGARSLTQHVVVSFVS